MDPHSNPPPDSMSYTRVCVSGLPRDIRLGQLESMLAQHCQNRIMRIDLRDRFAYVDFENANDAASCLGNYSINASVITVEPMNSSNSHDPSVPVMPDGAQVISNNGVHHPMAPAHHRALSDSETLRKFKPLSSDSLLDGSKGKRSRNSSMQDDGDEAMNLGDGMISSELPPRPPALKITSPGDGSSSIHMDDEDAPLISPEHKKRTTKFSRIRGGCHRRVYSDGDVLRNFEPALHSASPLIPNLHGSEPNSMPGSPSSESVGQMETSSNGMPLPRRNRTGLSYKCGKCGQPKKGHVCVGTPVQQTNADSELSYSWQLEANSIFKDMEAALADDGEMSVTAPFVPTKVPAPSNSKPPPPPTMSRSNSWDPQLTRTASFESVGSPVPPVSGAPPTSHAVAAGLGAYKCGKCGQPKKGHVCKASGTHVSRQKSSESLDRSKSNSSATHKTEVASPVMMPTSASNSAEMQKSMMDGVQSLELSDMDMMLADLAFAAPGRPPPVVTPEEGSIDYLNMASASQPSLSPDMFSPGTMISQLLAAPTPQTPATNFTGTVVESFTDQKMTITKTP